MTKTERKAIRVWSDRALAAEREVAALRAELAQRRGAQGRIVLCDNCAALRARLDRAVALLREVMSTDCRFAALLAEIGGDDD